ncbi:NAD(P)-dependent alcohol dehydrogenase [Oscillochloris sp. ZM17-4]|uniref:zinc-dependent alcohol dehydrogenase family protein n=1 Tax=Oscillochloris sp. ZM17-4 TaxID=2866714 RepID=UPI001C732AC5|nr:NAD(P)-dependent alcohol dehydrogenase [Oscillochloris sp. ZM17-4]MBX0330602.1 NAD(P)-dependent alcohol dehydrogenase [Oscillochloris sp. ZM17-4]
MKVFQLDGGWSADHLMIAERPTPVPGPGQALLRMRAAALNYRDMVVLQRGYGAQTGTLPLIPLSDGVGEVVALGPGVSRVKVGERVCPTFFQRWAGGPPNADRLASSLGGPLDGVMAEYMAVDAEGLAHVPDHLSDAEAATLPCAALTAWSALVTEGRVQPGERVLIQGTGGVSLFALQFAKLIGAFAIVTSSSGEKLERARALGADATLSYRETPEWGRSVREIAGGDGVDHIVEVGGQATLPQSLRAIRPGGTISMIGVLSGSSMDARLGLVVTRQVRLQGITVGSRDGFEAMARAIGQHQLRPVVDRVFAFEELPQAFAHLTSGAHFGKVCIGF